MNINTIETEIEKFRYRSKTCFEFHNKAIRICLDHLSVLRKTIVYIEFESEEKEIHFFKETKQEALHNLIYHRELKSFQIEYPSGSGANQKKFIRSKLEKIDRFFKSNSEFIQYITQDSNHLDRFYFTRKFATEFQIATVVSYYRSPEFSTSHDLVLAILKANRKLVKFYTEKLQELNQPLLKEIPQSNLKWTSSKTALTELTYALYHGGAVNNGNTNIIEIAEALQSTFNFSIGDVYRTYTELRSRKKGRTKFLDELSTSLISGMDQLDK